MTLKTCYLHSLFTFAHRIIGTCTTQLPAYVLPLGHLVLSLAMGKHRIDLGQQRQAQPWPESWPSLPQSESECSVSSSLCLHH